MTPSSHACLLRFVCGFAWKRGRIFGRPARVTIKTYLRWRWAEGKGRDDIALAMRSDVLRKGLFCLLATGRPWAKQVKRFNGLLRVRVRKLEAAFGELAKAARAAALSTTELRSALGSARYRASKGLAP